MTFIDTVYIYICTSHIRYSIYINIQYLWHTDYGHPVSVANPISTPRFVVWNAAVLAALPGSTAGDPLEVLRSSGSPLVSGNFWLVMFEKDDPIEKVC